MEAILQEAYEEIKDVNDLVSPTLGPLGVDIMILTATNSCLLCKSAFNVLKAYKSKRAVGKMVLQTIIKQGEINGDGSNFLISLIYGILYGMQTLVKQKFNITQISSTLNTIRQEYLINDFIIEMERKSICYRKDDFFKVKEGCSSFIHTLLSGNLTRKSETMIQSLLIDMIFSSNVESIEDMKSILNILERDVSCIIMPCYNKAIEQSYFLSKQDFVIKKDFMKHLVSKNVEISGAPFILLHCSIEYVPSTLTKINISDSSQFATVINYESFFVEQILHILSKRGVKLVISSEKLPDSVCHLAMAVGIMVVQYVDDKELFALSIKCGVEHLEDCSIETISNTPLCFADKISRSTLLGSSCLLFQGIKSNSNKKIPNQLILCGQGEGIVNQYIFLFKRAISAIKKWIESESDGCLYLCLGGGAFEIQAFLYFTEKAKRYPLHSINFKILNIIAEAMLFHVSKLVQSQDTRCSVDEIYAKSNDILENLVNLHEKNSNCQIGLIVRRGRFVLRNVVKENILDPLSMKIGCLMKCIEALYQLSRIDSVIQIKSKTKDAKEIDFEDEN